MKKLTARKILAMVISVMVLTILALPVVVGAQDPFGVDEAQFAGLGTQDDLKETIRQIVNLLLGFLGIIAVIILLWGGFMWMTAAGDEGKVDKAKKLIVAAIIGIIIIIAAWSIVAFVFREASGVLN